MVSESRVSTGHTGEDRLSRSVALINTTAYGTGARSIMWVNRNYGHTGQPSLVLDKGSKLEERPVMQRSSLGATQPYPPADTLEVFKSNPATGVFRAGHDAFADRVVGIRSKPVFLAGQLLEASARRLRALALQPGAQATMAITHVVHGVTTVNRPVAVRREVDNAQVHAQEFAYVFGRGFLHLAHLVQVEFAAPKDQVRFALHERQQGKLTLARDKRDGLPSAHRPDAYGLRGQLPGQDVAVIGDAAMRAESTPRFAVELVGVGDLRQQANGHLGRQLVALAHIVVAGVVQVVLAKRLGVPGVCADEVRRRVRHLKCALQQVGLFRRRLELDLRNQFHAYQYSTTVQHFQVLKG